LSGLDVNDRKTIFGFVHATEITNDKCRPNEVTSNLTDKLSAYVENSTKNCSQAQTGMSRESEVSEKKKS
jgi:hypothetical protein